MSLRCNECEMEFDTRDEAREHVLSMHTDVIDEELAEYLSDATDEVYDRLIEGEEGID